MANDGWKAPATVLGIFTLLGSLYGNYIQYRNNQEQLTQQYEQLAQVKAQWEEERLKTRAEGAKLEAELNDLKQREYISNSARGTLISELTQVNQNIAGWDRFIAQKQYSRKVEVDYDTGFGKRPHP